MNEKYINCPVATEYVKDLSAQAAENGRAIGREGAKIIEQAMLARQKRLAKRTDGAEKSEKTAVKR